MSAGKETDTGTNILPEENTDLVSDEVPEKIKVEVVSGPKDTTPVPVNPNSPEKIQSDGIMMIVIGAIVSIIGMFMSFTCIGVFIGVPMCGVGGGLLGLGVLRIYQAGKAREQIAYDKYLKSQQEQNQNNN